MLILGNISLIFYNSYYYRCFNFFNDATIILVYYNHGYMTIVKYSQPKLGKFSLVGIGIPEYHYSLILKYRF